MSRQELLDAEDELDLSADSAVDIVTATFTIESVEKEEKSSDNGSGTQYALTFTSDDFPYPITMRFFTAYESATGKNTDWVKRQRGQLKNIARAATGEPVVSTNPDSPNYLVGKQVVATTRDGGEGFAVLGRFKAVNA